MSPNISACRPFTGTASSAARTGPFAWNTHFKHPVSARIACTMPPALPTNRWPSSTVGCAKAEASPSKPKAHFSLRFLTCSTRSPAPACDWKRALSVPGLQPFHAMVGLAASRIERSVQ